MAPHEDTTISPEKISSAPLRWTETPVISRPDGLVSSRVTRALVTSVTFG